MRSKSCLSNKCGDMEFKRAKIIACKPKPNYRVWIRFDDEPIQVKSLDELYDNFRSKSNDRL
jgi:hypothetical protein